MAIDLKILPYGEVSKEMFFSKLKIRHSNCENPGKNEIRINHDKVTRIYTLNCQCGLSIELIKGQDAEVVLSKCATMSVDDTLPSESYTSNVEGPIRVSTQED
jgi:hypothetical protein